MSLRWQVLWVCHGLERMYGSCLPWLLMWMEYQNMGIFYLCCVCVCKRQGLSFHCGSWAIKRIFLLVFIAGVIFVMPPLRQSSPEATSMDCSEPPCLQNLCRLRALCGSGVLGLPQELVSWFTYHPFSYLALYSHSMTSALRLEKVQQSPPPLPPLRLSWKTLSVSCGFTSHHILKFHSS